MSNREDAKTFTVTTYREDRAGNIYRMRETVRDAYFTADGGYVPQQTEWFTESEVKHTDADYTYAVRYLTELAEATAMGAGG